VSGTEGRLPDFVIIGAPKSGTSSMYSYLREHPDTFLPREKEVRFFTERYDRGASWYREQFAEAGDAKAVGEATPMYLGDPSVAPRMAALLPEARLVAMLRDPVDRAYSHFWHRRLRVGETRDFDEAVASEAADPSSVPFPAIAYLELGRYVRQLERLTTYYDRAQVHVIIFEEMNGAPRETFAELCRFLSIDDSYVPPNLGVAYNTSHATRSERFRIFMLKHGIDRRFPELAQRINQLNKQKVDYPPLSDRQRREVGALFTDDNAALARWLGRDQLPWPS
jgi:hypothetical protein